MRYTSRLQVESRQLRADERKECQRAVDFCMRKLEESPQPQTFWGKMIDSLKDQKRWREMRNATLRFNQAVLQADGVEVLRCRPVAVVQLAQHEDEGHHYFFDVGENTLLFFGGQDYAPSKSFPNTDFELVRVNGQGIFRMNRLGDKLSPVRTIPSREAQALPAYAGAIFSFPGDLSSTESDYQRYVQGKTIEDFREWFV